MWRVPSVQDCVQAGFRQDIDVEDVVDLPVSREFKSVCQV